MNVPELLDNTKDITLTSISEREGSIVAYRRILIALIRDIRRAVNEHVMPVYSSSLIPDAVMDKRKRLTRFAAVKAVVAVSVDTASEKTALLFEDESASHLVRVVRSLKKGTGLDVGPYLQSNMDSVDDLARLYINRNAALIKSLSDDTVNSVEQAVFQAKIDRTTYKDLTKILQKRFNIAKNRADLIAYDQLASANSDFTKARHTALGIKRYRWRTRADGRTRPLHVDLSGNEYEWGKPTGAENGLPPGKPIRCRCTAVSIIPANPKAIARNERARQALIKSNNEARARAKAEEAKRRANR